ncbi:ATP-binding protein [Romboutsia hominis]|uniref:ATP-binding protein n=1 Tax=Romboutsia hominis TaxID=1507512 RepID=UPI002ED5597C
MDNSIEARYKFSLKSEICKIIITIDENSIIVEDNSGGISENISEEELFKIDCNNGNGSGLGIKKSFFTLGKKIEIFSNKRELSRVFSLDTSENDQELESKSKSVNYDDDKEEGARIVISNLNANIKKYIKRSDYKNTLKQELGYMYRKFIDKNKVIILVNGELVESRSVNGVKLCSMHMNKYNVRLYKGNKGENSGIEVFINDYMKLDRENGKKEVKWTKLRQPKYTYENCVVEVDYYGEVSEYEESKELFYEQLIEFIKDNKESFKNRTITIQYEVSIDKVEELKEYYNEISAKAIGKKAFDKLYEIYKMENKKS